MLHVIIILHHCRHYIKQSKTTKRLASCTLCLHDLLFVFVFLVSKEHLDLMKLFGFAGTLAMSCVFVFRFFSFLFDVVTQSMSQGLRPVEVSDCWRWKAAYANVHRLHLLILYQSWPAEMSDENSQPCTCLCPIHSVSCCLIVSLFSGFWQECVLSWSLNGADGEPYWPFTMGLQNIWRKGLQEGHYRIKGTHQ